MAPAWAVTSRPSAKLRPLGSQVAADPSPSANTAIGPTQTAAVTTASNRKELPV